LTKTGNHLRIQIVNYNYQHLLSGQISFLNTLKEWGFKEAGIKNYGIEIKLDELNCDNVLRIFEKQYNLAIG
jgi:hypothetical protein